MKPGDGNDPAALGTEPASSFHSRPYSGLRDHATAFLSHPALIIVAYVIAAESAKRVFYRNPAGRK
jgi:hypothetical protein